MTSPKAKSKLNRDDHAGAALRLAGLGLPVLPLHWPLADTDPVRCSCGDAACKSVGKHPRNKGGSRGSTKDQAQVRGWWGRWPLANPGIATGGGLFVVAPDGAQGLADLAELERRHGALPRTVRARSGGGGAHLYFRCPPGHEIRNRKNHRGLKIDVRGDGGYVVAPESMHASGNRYEWEVAPWECEIAEAPQWLLDWCGDAAESKDAVRKQTRSTWTMTATGGGTSDVGRAIDYLAKVDPAISGQGGHDQTLWAARVVVRGFALGPTEGLRVLLQHYNPRCQPPWTEMELRHKCEEAATQPFDMPHGWLLNEGNARHEGNGQPQGATPAGQSDDWQPPLELSGKPAVPEFPMQVLPTACRRFIADGAAAKGCPEDYLAVPMLAIAGAAIGTTRVLQVKPGWEERPCLYCGVVGEPGGCKSGAQDDVTRPFERRQAELDQEHQKALEKWEEDGEGKRPRLKVAYVSDVTCEKYAELLKHNPRGIPRIEDELVAWVNSLNQYRGGQGRDRQFYLSGWAGKPISVHRKDPESPAVFVERPFIAVVGGLQPDLLSRFTGEKGANDGFFDRVLFSYPDEPQDQEENWRCVSDDIALGWEQILQNLWKLDHRKNTFSVGGGPCPVVLKLADSGREGWKKFTRELARQLNEEGFPKHLKGPWKKFRGYCVRFALILHCLREAAGEQVGKDVDGDTVGRAAELVEYFQGHCRRVHHTLAADPQVADARYVRDWLAKHPDLMVFSRRDVHQGLRGNERFQIPASLDGPLQILERYGYIRRQKPDRERGPGRPSDRYDRNPKWAIP
jgi:hypothetical protein